MDKKLQAQIEASEQHLKAGEYEQASEILIKFTKMESIAPLAYYRLAFIANATKDPLTAKTLYYKAFSLAPDVCKFLLGPDHPNHGYVFSGKKNEPLVESCPLCGKAGEPYWCYVLIEMGAAYAQDYNPVRLWMYCADCHHLYAEEFPIQKVVTSKSEGMQTITNLFPDYSVLLSKLGSLTQGDNLLEIGVGGSECALVAQEMGFNVFGLDIDEGNVLQARRYGINAEIHDFMEFKSDQKWDIIVMGDVIEHVSDPVAAMEKLCELLNDGGCIWLSTPNFDGAYSRAMGHGDAMRREPAHKNYFSRFSLFKLLERFRLVPVDYKHSSHYNGSVEVIAVKGGEENTP